MQLVESVISDMGNHHKDQFHAVRLNGFIHTDDKLALREIWRQLGKEMEVEDELVKASPAELPSISTDANKSRPATMLIPWRLCSLFYRTLLRLPRPKTASRPSRSSS